MVSPNDATLLAKVYLGLPLHEKVKLAQKIGCWSEIDIRLNNVELGKKIFKFAKEENRLQELLHHLAGGF